MPDRAEEEIENGRLWRAKEILRGRLAQTSYDPELFAHLAGVLARMHDTDEAGRYFLLAGRSEGRGGELARAFLARRRHASFTRLWSEMPAAARRGAGQAMPPATHDLLTASGYAAAEIDSHLAKLDQRSKQRRARRKRRLLDAANAKRGERIGLAVAAILLVILTLGLVSLIRLLWWGLGWIFGF